MNRLPLLTWLAASMLLFGCGTSKECAEDEDCPSPEVCIEGACIDDSCPTGCSIGEYCSYSVCYPCNRNEHCGDMCLDCTNQGLGQSCVMFYPSQIWDCGCYSDYGCPSGMCCNASQCTTCP